MSQIPIPLTRIPLHELQNQVSRIAVERGPFNACGSLGNPLVQHNGGNVGFMEWWETREHFEYEDAESVPIDGFVVPRVSNDLHRGRQ